VRGTGAEGLLGKGDFLAVLGGEVIRLQAAFATGAEVARTVTLLHECAQERAGSGQPRAAHRTGTMSDDEAAERRGLWKAQRGPIRLLKSGS
jgi:DNA segregation ATPase FtsK/SpoIIIE-like protein